MLRLILAFMTTCASFAAAAQERVALVIGNSEYQSVTRLDNPSNDARAISAALESHGFTVFSHIDLEAQNFRRTLRDFRSAADAADYAIVYYAGHGIEIEGQNYLVPVDAVLQETRDADLELIKLSLVLNQVSGAKKMKMIVLDACRNNPFEAMMRAANGNRSVNRGLATLSRAEAGANTVVAYAAAAGELTPDGVPGGNSPFTTAFLEALQGPEMDVRRLLGTVGEIMGKRVPGSVPFVYTSLGGGEYIINPRSEPDVAPPPAINEETMFEDYMALDDNADATALEAFLAAYAVKEGNPLYRLAQRRLRELGETPATQTATAGTSPTFAPDPAAPSVGPSSPAPFQMASLTPDDLDVETPLAPSPARSTSEGPITPPKSPDQPRLPTFPGKKYETAKVPEHSLNAPKISAPTWFGVDNAPASPPDDPGQKLPSDPGQQDVVVASLRPSQRTAQDLSDALDETPAADDAPIDPVEVEPLMTLDESKRALQVMLADRKCYSGAIDGIIGRNSLRGMANLTPEFSGVSKADLDSVEEIQAAMQTIEAAGDAQCSVQKTVAKPVAKKKKPAPVSSNKPAPRKSSGPSCVVFEGVRICN